MTPLIRALVDAGIDVNEKTDSDGLTALMMAASMVNSTDAVETLLSAGASTDVRDFNDRNALFHACAFGNESTIQTLIAAGSSFLHRRMQPLDSPWEAEILCGPIHLVAARGMTKIVKLILEGSFDMANPDNSVPDNGAPDPLLMACVGNGSTVQLLLEHGFDPNLEDLSTGLRPLHIASRAGNLQIVQALLDGGCNKEARDRFGVTAWATATLHGRADVAELLQATTKSQPVQDSDHWTSLVEEHQRPDPMGTNREHEQSAMPMPQSLSGNAVQSPPFDRVNFSHFLPATLRQTLINGEPEVVRQLVMDGLDIRLPFAKCSCTPILIAVHYKRFELVRYLAGLGLPLFTEQRCSSHFVLGGTVLERLATDPVWTRLIEQCSLEPMWHAQLSQKVTVHMIASAIESNNPETLRVLLTKVGRPIPSCDTAGSRGLFSPIELLHKAIKNSDTSCATILLSYGLDVDCVDQYGRTALHRATSFGQLDMVELLVSHSAAVNVVSTFGGTALSVAAGTGYMNILNHLLASGARPNFSLSPSQAPLTCAAVQGQYPAFRALLHAGGTAQAQDYYSLYARGHRSVLMLDPQLFCAMQGPDLLHHILSPQAQPLDSVRAISPIMKSMSFPRRALCFATLHPTERTMAFYQSAINGTSRSVDLMIRYGASINMEGSFQGTPLMAACFAGHLPIVKLLVRSGALLSYWNGTSHVSALVKAQHHPKILRWLLVGRFTETLRLTGSPTGGEVHSESAETLQGNANETNIDLILEDDIDSYFEKNFWFVPARRFVDSGDGSFDTVDILPSDFAKFKPTYI
jgi:ankyrin repeat protein